MHDSDVLIPLKSGLIYNRLRHGKGGNQAVLIPFKSGLIYNPSTMLNCSVSLVLIPVKSGLIYNFNPEFLEIIAL